MEGLATTNRLIKVASEHHDCILAPHLYRVATTEDNVRDLQKTALELPQLCQWLSPNEMKTTMAMDDEANDSAVLGGLKLSNGCQVIHVPSYLKGLWDACRSEFKQRVQWRILDSDMTDIVQQSHLEEFDAVVYCTGSTLFEKKKNQDIPVQLVRGQAVELIHEEQPTKPIEPLLCGKYVIPLSPQRTLVGATHEYNEEPLSPTTVRADLEERLKGLLPSSLLQARVDRLTSGIRVQSRRVKGQSGNHGRVPIIGEWSPEGMALPPSTSSWIFSGLSSRGLLFHGVYGDLLTDAILAGTEQHIMEKHPHLAFWKGATWKGKHAT